MTVDELRKELKRLHRDGCGDYKVCIKVGNAKESGVGQIYNVEVEVGLGDLVYIYVAGGY